MSGPFEVLAIQSAQKAGIDINIFVRQIQQESGFNPNARSPAGAQGIAQFMPSTAAGLGINPWDPNSALPGAALYDARNLKKYGGDYSKMLAAYNAGGGAVDNAVANYGSSWLSHMPTETQHYVQAILGGQNVPSNGGFSNTPSPSPNNNNNNANNNSNDPCANCGPVGSAAYMHCVAAVAQGDPQVLPPCAKQSPSLLDQAAQDALKGVQAAFQPLFNQLPIFGMHIALFLGAMMLLVIGLMLISSKGVNAI